VFAKVPYRSLGDKFVTAKLEKNPDWYKEDAIKNILQGTGRSIRSVEDFCTTYILDACLGDLIHHNRKSFPEEFMQRLILVD
jgi:Rad3-related DNA helicase